MPPAAVQALIIVDVQDAFVAGPHPIAGAEALVASVTDLLDRARQAGSLVVHLQNQGQPSEPDAPDQPGWALHLVPAAGESVLAKDCDDGFDSGVLGQLLTRYQVSRIALAGTMSEMCVSATARSALRSGLGVVLPHDAHGTYDIPAAAWFDQVVPASVVARVAEWALGDGPELVARSNEVTFAACSKACDAPAQ